VFAESEIAERNPPAFADRRVDDPPVLVLQLNRQSLQASPGRARELNLQKARDCESLERIGAAPHPEEQYENGNELSMSHEAATAGQ
jgi:hypothetical protein